MSATAAQEIRAHLALKGLRLTEAWLNSFQSTQSTAVPVSSLKQTAMYRVLHSDISTTLQTGSGVVLPPNILDASVAERKLPGVIPVQVIDVEDIGRSKWSQVEALESVERGEMTKGREIIRVVPGEDEGSEPPRQLSSTGPHKVLLQDAAGCRVYGFELSPVSGVNLNMAIGAKLVLKDVTVARGVVLLQPTTATLLGGRIDELHKRWKEELKEKLKRAAQSTQPIT
jgi:RecQ-mediated genome instability protein 1